MTFVYIVLGIAGAFVALMVGMRVLIAYKSSAMKNKPAPPLDGKMGKRVSKGKTALFYFFSPGCGACGAMTPVVNEMCKSNDGVFPIDISKDMQTARKFGVMATPTVVVVRDKVVKDVIIGPQSASTLQQLAV